ncbi:MAG: nitrite reductase small subunit NirD [Gammaproteobacteria bacterium]|nr:nitrite reductase small subunit NirD [Gammaproteobacteria bacterium]
MSQMFEVCGVEDIPVLGSKVVSANEGNIAVFRASDGEFFALKDECPHKQGPLSQGIVHNKKVTCPLHNWVISLETGMAQEPDEGCAARYPVEVKDKKVFLILKAMD